MPWLVSVATIYPVLTRSFTLHAALSVYEFVLNLDLEVITAWKRKTTLASVLVITTRWLMLLNGILTIAPYYTFQVRSQLNSTLLLTTNNDRAIRGDTQLFASGFKLLTW